MVRTRRELEDLRGEAAATRGTASELQNTLDGERRQWAEDRDRLLRELAECRSKVATLSAQQPSTPEPALPQADAHFDAVAEEPQGGPMAAISGAAEGIVVRESVHRSYDTFVEHAAPARRNAPAAE